MQGPRPFMTLVSGFDAPYVIVEAADRVPDLSGLVKIGKFPTGRVHARSGPVIWPLESSQRPDDYRTDSWGRCRRIHGDALRIFDCARIPSSPSKVRLAWTRRIEPSIHVHQSELMIGATGSPVTLHFSAHLRRAGKSCQLDWDIWK